MDHVLQVLAIAYWLSCAIVGGFSVVVLLCSLAAGDKPPPSEELAFLVLAAFLPLLNSVFAVTLLGRCMKWANGRTRA